MLRSGVTAVFDVICGVCVVGGWIAGKLFMGIAGAAEEERRALRGGGRNVYNSFFCHWRETGRREIADVFDVVCDICIGSR